MVKALSNVEKSFDNIKSVTQEWNVWKPGWVLNQLYHPQGIAISGDKYYVSHNGISEGYIYVFKEGIADELDKERKILGGSDYNHPGTIQIANHLLLATLQKQSGGSYKGTQVMLLDIKDWSKAPCVLLKDDDMNGKGIAGIVCVESDNNGENQRYVAISDKNIYEIRISGNEISHFVPGRVEQNGTYKYNSTLFWPKDSFDGTVDVQSVNLLVDKEGTIYAITAGVKDKHRNILRLYQMEIQDKDSSNRIVRAKMKYLKEKEIALCNSWLTFSAGTGIDIKGESIIVYVTSKPATSSRKMTIGSSTE